MKPLTRDKLASYIEGVRGKLADKSSQELKLIEKSMDIDFQEHFQFQQTQAESHAAGILTPEAAVIIYNALGPVWSDKNGGWGRNTDLATKFTVTKVMGELLGMKIAAATATA